MASETTGAMSSILGGASAGSMFGPVGTVVGGIIGAGMYMSGKSGRRRERTAGVKQAYGIAQQSFSYLGKGQEMLESSYASSLSSARARQAGSGASLEGSRWDSIQGGLLQERTEAQTILNREREEFRGGEAYQIFEADYRYMTDTGGGYNKPSDSRSWGLGNRGMGGDQMFSDEQRGRMQTFSLSGREGNPKFSGLAEFGEYTKMITPTIGEWETGRFGSKEQKAEFSSMIDTRIEKANVWYEQKQKELQVSRANQQNFYGERGRR